MLPEEVHLAKSGTSPFPFPPLIPPQCLTKPSSSGDLLLCGLLSDLNTAHLGLTMEEGKLWEGRYKILRVRTSFPPPTLSCHVAVLFLPRNVHISARIAIIAPPARYVQQGWKDYLSPYPCPETEGAEGSTPLSSSC